MEHNFLCALNVSKDKKENFNTGNCNWTIVCCTYVESFKHECWKCIWDKGQ